ncbi:MAG TPA: tetratricopeptide repeat protein [Nitrospiria bacterium]
MNRGLRIPNCLTPVLAGLLIAACGPVGGGGGGISSPTSDEAVLPPEDYSNKKAAGWNRDGIDHLKREHWRKAAADFARALEVDPDFAHAHFNRGLALRQQGKEADATEHFRLALKHGGADPNIVNSPILPEDLKKNLP